MTSRCALCTSSTVLCLQQHMMWFVFCMGQPTADGHASTAKCSLSLLSVPDAKAMCGKHDEIMLEHMLEQI